MSPSTSRPTWRTWIATTPSTDRGRKSGRRSSSFTPSSTPTIAVDNDAVFVAGYNSGGALANMWGCYFAGDGAHPWNGKPGGAPGAAPRRFAPRFHIRAQAVTYGVAEPDNDPPCNGLIAAIWIDDQYYGDRAATARARVLAMNGCASATPRTAPWHPEVEGVGVCQQYIDCPKSTPVVSCTTIHEGMSDGHERAIPAFKLFFDEVLSPP